MHLLDDTLFLFFLPWPFACKAKPWSWRPLFLGGGYFNSGEVGFCGPWVSAVSALVPFPFPVVIKDFFYTCQPGADENKNTILYLSTNRCSQPLVDDTFSEQSAYEISLSSPVYTKIIN